MAEEIRSDDPRYPSQYGYVRCRQLEGTYPEDAGCWNVTWQRVLCGWGLVTQEDWVNGQPEPPGIDDKAKKNRSRSYYRIRDYSECVRFIDKELPFSASFEIWNQWYSAKEGIIEEVPEFITPIESHAVLMSGYTNSGALVFNNSWGLAWGHQGLGMMSRQSFENWLIDAWQPNFTPVEPKKYIHRGMQFEVILSESPIGLPYATGRLYDYDKDDKVGWFSCRQNETFWDVEELFIKPEYRGRGYSRALMLQIKNMAEFHGLPIRLWVSYADSYEVNHPALLKVASFLGLELKKSPVPWASYVGMPGPTPNVLPSIRIPARPKSIRDKKQSVDKEPEVIFSDELEEYLWARKGRRARIRQAKEDD
jgi:GNAT superfamily N-acetyltransferase